jgi:hypothetical protein
MTGEAMRAGSVLLNHSTDLIFQVPGRIRTTYSSDGFLPVAGYDRIGCRVSDSCFQGIEYQKYLYLQRKI